MSRNSTKTTSNQKQTSCIIGRQVQLNFKPKKVNDKDTKRKM